MIEAIVTVMPKRSVLDPQGVAVQKAVIHHGLTCVREVRVGKVLRLELEGDDLDKTRQRLEQICADFLSNPVMEDYQLELRRLDPA